MLILAPKLCLGARAAKLRFAGRWILAPKQSLGARS